MSNYFEVEFFDDKVTFFSTSFVGDAPIKAIEFDGYMVLKNTLNGDRIPICRVEDLEITLVSPDLPVKVRLPRKDEHQWRSLSEVRAAEVQCMQLSLALLARHESEMYVTIEADRNRVSSLQSTYNQHEQPSKTRSSATAVQKHLDECEKIFSDNSRSLSTTSKELPRQKSSDMHRVVQSTTMTGKSLPRQNSADTNKTVSHAPSDRYHRSSDSRSVAEQPRKSVRHSSHAISSSNHSKGN